MFLKKAGVIAMKLGNAQKALDYFERIKADYANSDDGKNIDVLIGKASASL